MVKGVVFTFTFVPSILNEALSTPFTSSVSNVYVNGSVPPSADKIATTASALTFALPSCSPSCGVIVNPVISGSIMLLFFLFEHLIYLLPLIHQLVYLVKQMLLYVYRL